MDGLAHVFAINVLAPYLLTALISFGALAAFIMVNLSVLAYHGVQQHSRRWLRHWLLPAIGVLLVGYVLVSIQLLAYPIETAIAEKLQAMVALGSANSRMKDFYDVWVCSAHLDLNAKTLLKAIAATFENRQTPMPAEDIQAFSAEFVRSHRVQWKAFVKKIGEESLADAFGRVTQDLSAFAMPAFRALASGANLSAQWKAATGWNAP